MAAYDDLNTKRIFIVGILSIVVTAVTALAVQVVYYALVSWHDADLAEKSSYRRQNAVLATQAAEIGKYGVNPETAAVTIPIEKAMQLIAADNDDGPPAHNEKAEKHNEKAEKHSDKKAADKKDTEKKNDESKETDAV